jgi:hypothetical protein
MGSHDVERGEVGETRSLLAEREDKPDDVSKSGDIDPDVIIPDEIAFPLVLSSHLLLVTAAVSLSYAIIFRWDILYGTFATAFVLYITSVAHWSRPRFSSMIRICDYFAVFLALAYGSFVACTLSMTYILVWFIGIGIVGVIFATNEVSPTMPFHSV